MAIQEKKRQLQIVIVGHVDHGKSTLIGRLLHDTDSLPPGKLEELEKISQKRGMVLEWSFVLDAFQAERDQAVTIDTSQIWFKSDKRDYVIIDAPGHREFLKNMISGAAQADAAILVVDAHEGIREQTRRHAYLLHLLGIRQIAVVVNKMDMVDYSAKRFGEVANELRAYLDEIGVVASTMIPIAARHGENMVNRAENMAWYEGGTLLEALDKFDPRPQPVAQPLRFPIQDVYRYDDERRVLVGRIESGILRKGDELVFSPSNRTARVTGIEAWNVDPKPVEAKAGQSIGITLDQPIYAERGDIASHADKAPMLTNVFRANIFWLSDKALKVGDRFRVKLVTSEYKVTVQSIDKVVDTQDLSSESRAEVKRNDVAEVTFRSTQMMALDPYGRNFKTGRCVLFDQYDVVGGGIINMDGYADQRQTMTVKGTNLYAVDHLLNAEARSWRNGHKGAVVWFTGLSGSGKSTLAMKVERELFNKGLQVYVLDGDNVRKGLNADLGFSPEDRAENIRRIGEVAALMADAGVIVVTAFISPYQADRARARMAAPKCFHEVYIKADLETCEGRDPKGLYKKARKGEIKDFTGISSPYEPPEAPDLLVDTESLEVDVAVQNIVSYILKQVNLEGVEDGAAKAANA